MPFTPRDQAEIARSRSTRALKNGQDLKTGRFIAKVKLTIKKTTSALSTFADELKRLPPKNRRERGGTLRTTMRVPSSLIADHRSQAAWNGPAYKTDAMPATIKEQEPVGTIKEWKIPEFPPRSVRRFVIERKPIEYRDPPAIRAWIERLHGEETPEELLIRQQKLKKNVERWLRHTNEDDYLGVTGANPSTGMYDQVSSGETVRRRHFRRREPGSSDTVIHYKNMSFLGNDDIDPRLIFEESVISEESYKWYKDFACW